MHKHLSKNSEAVFKHPEDNLNTRLSSTISWSKQPLAAKIYQKGADVEHVQSEFPLDLNSRSNNNLPVPLSKLEETAQAPNIAPASNTNYFYPFRRRTKRQRQPPIVITDYELPKNKILKTKGITSGTFHPYDGFIFPYSAVEEQDYQDNIHQIFPPEN